MALLSPQDLQAVWLSAKVASAATLLALPLGVGLAYAQVFRKLPGRTLIDGVVNLPLVLPPVVVGYLLLLLCSEQGVVGAFLARLGIPVIFSLNGAILASTVVGFPLLVRSIRLGMEGIDPELVAAARTLGAGPWDVLATVILPLARPAILGGMTLMFARSLGEFGATIVLAGNIPGVTQTIPLAIYDYANTPGGEDRALNLCLVAIVLSLAVLLVNEHLAGRSRRRVRR